MRLLLNPRQRLVKAIVIHLHAPPRLKPQGLARGQGQFPQHLNAQIFAPLLFMASTRAFPSGDLPHFGNERHGEGDVGLQLIH